MKAKTPANHKSFFDLSPPEAAGPVSSKSVLVGGDLWSTGFAEIAAVAA
jgi:hypothetical protein